MKLLFTKRLFIASAIALSLGFASCNKRDGDITNQVEQAPTDDEYITLQLSINGENGLKNEEQGLRTFFSRVNDLPKFSFGTDGSKVKVVTKIATRIDNNGNVTVVQVYNQALDWTVANGGRRLTYNGTLKILRSQLAGSPRLRLFAGVLNKSNTANPESFGPIPVQEITDTPNALNLDIPYAMSLELDRSGDQGRILKGKAGFTPIFKPLGELAYFSVKNTGNANITFTGLRGDGMRTFTDLEYKAAYPPNDPSLQADASSSEASPFGFNKTARDLGPVIGIKSNVTITPSQTKYFVAWRPEFHVPGGQPKNIFTPTFSEDLTIDYPGTGTYRKFGLIKWAIEAHNYTTSGDFYGDGEDFPQ